MAVRPRCPQAGPLAAVVVLVLLGGGCSTPSSTEAAAPGPSTGTPTSPATSPATTATPSERPTIPEQTASRPAATSRPSATSEPAVLLRSGDSGTRVRELQHRLRQLDWYAGSITGHYRASTVEAVKGFQDKRRLEVTGAVDRATWTSLRQRTRQPTDDELHDRLRPGPALMRSGSAGDRVRDLQARLEQIAWFPGPVTGSYGPVTVTAVRGFQGKRGIPVTGEVDQRTWDRLTAMTRTPTADELRPTAGPSRTGLDPRCLTGRAMCVSKTTNSLVWVVDGHPRLRTDVRFGSAELPTREGSFRVGWKSRYHVSTIYHTSMPYAMFFSGGQAVHYSADFAARGYAGASHGCVNVRSMSAIQTLFTQVRVGDKVIVYR